ncbi:MAG: hypothetical protein AAFY25_05600, partial [Pseudomonadota bacterium]
MAKPISGSNLPKATQGMTGVHQWHSTHKADVEVQKTNSMLVPQSRQSLPDPQQSKTYPILCLGPFQPTPKCTNCGLATGDGVAGALIRARPIPCSCTPGLSVEGLE